MANVLFKVTTSYYCKDIAVEGEDLCTSLKNAIKCAKIMIRCDVTAFKIAPLGAHISVLEVDKKYGCYCINNELTKAAKEKFNKILDPWIDNIYKQYWEHDRDVEKINFD